MKFLVSFVVLPFVGSDRGALERNIGVISVDDLCLIGNVSD